LEHRKFSSGQVAIEQWCGELKAKDVPVLLCLTHADRLYAECIDDDGTLEPTAYKQKTIDADLTFLILLCTMRASDVLLADRCVTYSA